MTGHPLLAMVWSILTTFHAGDDAGICTTLPPLHE